MRKIRAFVISVITVISYVVYYRVSKEYSLGQFTLLDAAENAGLAGLIPCIMWLYRRITK